MSLISLTDHNLRKRKENIESVEASKRTGVACPDCGEELDGPVYRVEGVEKVVIVWEAIKK